MQSLVDTRKLKTGMYRLRWRLNKSALDTVMCAFKVSGYAHSCAALEAVCMNYISNDQSRSHTTGSAKGELRFLLRLYPDQYEIVREALDMAGAVTSCDEDALVTICRNFLKEFQDETSKDIYLDN